MAEISYDYIIAGGGMAGLSLAFYLNRSFLKDKKILIIDRKKKKTNDHTWCFWEEGKSSFEEIIYRNWDKFWFHGTENFNELLGLEKYKYKMIRAIDFYNFVIPKLNENPSIDFLQAEILKVENDLVKTNKGDFYPKEFIFDSFTRKKYDNPKYHNLWQHFLGWVIETEKGIFNPNQATLFDFRVEQKDECRFFYVLPFTENKALVEFTIFSDNLIERDGYEMNLQSYISKTLKVENYKIKETEFGIIPMSDEPHEKLVNSKTLLIGTSGGYVKASTGYSFKQTQNKLKDIVKSLEQNGSIKHPKSKKQMWKSYLDSVLLNVMQDKKHPINDVFTRLFKNSSTPRVMKFLDEDTTFMEDLAVMQTVPITPFTKASIKVLRKKLKIIL